MIPFARRSAAKLQAARRLLTGDRRLEDEPPDDQESVTTVPAAAVKIWHSSAAHDEPKEKEKLRRDLEDAAAQTNLMTATALHDALQAQVDSAAVTTLRTARAADDDDADDASYQVDRLMATRRQQGGRRQFLVR